MYLSHNDPEKELRIHLQEVFDQTHLVYKNLPVSLPYRSELELISRVAALTHDFGKYTSYFQTYLSEQEDQNKLQHHSFISALFGAFILSRLLQNEKTKLPYAPLLVYVVILHHHGNLRIVGDDVVSKRSILDDDVTAILKPRVRILEAQIEDLQVHSQVILDDYQGLLALLGIESKTILQEFAEDWVAVMDELNREHYLLKKGAKKGDPIIQDSYYYLLLLYSILLQADKYSAANIPLPARLEIPATLVDEYREHTFDTAIRVGMNGWRNRIYDTVMKKLEAQPSLLDSHDLFTLTAPTGSGKTFLSLAVACKWRNELQAKYGYLPRIIYALPFTSIIDQNEQEIIKLLEQLHDFEANRHRYVMKHHHLSTIQYRQEHEDLPLHQAFLLTESWESEMIITTFIQLFYTLIGYENKVLKKFHQIAGSIVILDEIQNIPVEYWPLLRSVLSQMGRLFGCKFILLTATQPLIFETGETVELLEDDQVAAIDFFQEVERVSLTLVTDDVHPYYEVDEWVQLLMDQFQDGKNYLAIFNTIASSIQVYNKLKSWLDERDYQVYYLSTNIIPLERKKRIQQINDALKKREEKSTKVMVISTQVVEAGVDFDFDIVYRDLGPIDSIIQAAGRCNRHGKLNRQGELGEVRVTPIARNGKLESILVYRGIHTHIAKSILPTDTVSEHQFIQLIQQYYTQLRLQKQSDDSAEILDAMLHLRFHQQDKTSQSLVSDFCLIPENTMMVDTFVEVDEEAKQIWQRYLTDVIYETDYKKRFMNRIQIKNRLRQYVISVPLRLVRNLVDDEFSRTRMIHLRHDYLDQYYQADVGIIRSQEDVGAWAL